MNPYRRQLNRLAIMNAERDSVSVYASTGV
jgi:hypothetical protein